MLLNAVNLIEGEVQTMAGGRPKQLKNKIQRTIQVSPDVWDRVATLAAEADISISQVFERAAIEVINSGKIPGLEILRLDPAGYTNAEVSGDDVKPQASELVGPQRRPAKTRAPSSQALQSK
jgi:hypothetical protein